MPWAPCWDWPSPWRRRDIASPASAASPCPRTTTSSPAPTWSPRRPPDWPGDLGIVVDYGRPGPRRRAAGPRASTGLPHLIDIDHHATEKSFGEVRLVDSAAAATAEIVYDVVRALPARGHAGDRHLPLHRAPHRHGRFAFTNTDARALPGRGGPRRARRRPRRHRHRHLLPRSFAAVRLLGVALGADAASPRRAGDQLLGLPAGLRGDRRGGLGHGGHHRSRSHRRRATRVAAAGGERGRRDARQSALRRDART